MVSEKVYECGKCGEAHLTPTNRWHDAASQAEDFQRIASFNGMTVAEVRSRLGYATVTPGRNRNAPAVTEAPTVTLCPGCNKPLTGRQTYCSGACKQRVFRKRASRT